MTLTIRTLSPGGDMKRKNAVLIVEDDNMTRELLCCAVDACGFEAHGYSDGIAALAAAAACCFDCVIIDYRMLKMNGVELTRHLRARFPALFIIGVSIEDKKNEFLEAGADGFRLKPFRLRDIEALLGMIRMMGVSSK